MSRDSSFMKYYILKYHKINKFPYILLKWKQTIYSVECILVITNEPWSTMTARRKFADDCKLIQPCGLRHGWCLSCGTEREME